jgi:hypothetical protein
MQRAVYNELMGTRQLGKGKAAHDDCGAWELETSPIWHLQGNEIAPGSLCLKWWQSLAEQKYGDKEQWLEVACELGYVVKTSHSKSGTVAYEPYGFEYDGMLVRKSLGLSRDGPLVFSIDSADSQSYAQMWNMLLRKKTDEDSGNLG